MKTKYNINNIDCAHCATKIEDAIGKIPQVDTVTVNFLTQKMVIGSSCPIDDIMPAIKKIIKKIEPDCEVSL